MHVVPLIQLLANPNKEYQIVAGSGCPDPDELADGNLVRPFQTNPPREPTSEQRQRARPPSSRRRTRTHRTHLPCRRSDSGAPERVIGAHRCQLLHPASVQPPSRHALPEKHSLSSSRIVYENVSVPPLQSLGSWQGITTTPERYNNAQDTDADRPAPLHCSAAGTTWAPPPVRYAVAPWPPPRGARPRTAGTARSEAS